MSQLNAQKVLTKFYETNFHISSNLLNLSLAKNSMLKNNLLQSKYKLDQILSLTQYCSINWGEKVFIAIGAERGFCGSFNKALGNIDNYYTVGKNLKSLKGKWSYSDLELFNDVTVKFHCTTECLKEISVKELWLPYNHQYIDNYIDSRGLWSAVVQSFIDYAIDSSLYNENKVRIAHMQSAKDNTRELLETNKKEYRKLRQQLVTSEILLSNSSIGDII